MITNRSSKTTKKQKELKKDIKQATEILTNWTKLKMKQQQIAAAEGKRFNDPSLWQLKSVGSFTAAEQKCLLKLCVPNSGVLSKNEKEHVDTFRKKNF